MFTAAPALAEVVTFKADLAGSNEVPPNDSKGTGTVDANLDTSNKTLTWTVDYSGLTGDAVAAHFHGPAARARMPRRCCRSTRATSAARSRAARPLPTSRCRISRTASGTSTSTPPKYPDGEIRGQLTKQ